MICLNDEKVDRIAAAVFAQSRLVRINVDDPKEYWLVHVLYDHGLLDMRAGDARSTASPTQAVRALAEGRWEVVS